MPSPTITINPLQRSRRGYGRGSNLGPTGQVPPTGDMLQAARDYQAALMQHELLGLQMNKFELEKQESLLRQTAIQQELEAGKPAPSAAAAKEASAQAVIAQSQDIMDPESRAAKRSEIRSRATTAALETEKTGYDLATSKAKAGHAEPAEVGAIAEVKARTDSLNAERTSAERAYKDNRADHDRTTNQTDLEMFMTSPQEARSMLVNLWASESNPSASRTALIESARAALALNLPTLRKGADVKEQIQSERYGVVKQLKGKISPESYDILLEEASGDLQLYLKSLGDTIKGLGSEVIITPDGKMERNEPRLAAQTEWQETLEKLITAHQERLTAAKAGMRGEGTQDEQKWKDMQALVKGSPEDQKALQAIQASGVRSFSLASLSLKGQASVGGYLEGRSVSQALDVVDAKAKAKQESEAADESLIPVLAAELKKLSPNRRGGYAYNYLSAATDREDFRSRYIELRESGFGPMAWYDELGHSIEEGGMGVRPQVTPIPESVRAAFERKLVIKGWLKDIDYVPKGGLNK